MAFGVKAGVNYNSNSIGEVSSDVFKGAESKTGYHAGVWVRFKIPAIGLYFRPELVYTNLENVLKADVIEVNIETKDTEIYMHDENKKVNIKNKN